MDKLTSIASLIDHLESCLDKLFLTGFGTAGEADIQELRSLATECDKFGLSFAAEGLGKLAAAWEQKRHSLTYDSSELVSSLCTLDIYLSTISSKLQLDASLASMKN